MSDFCENCNHHSSYHTTAVGEYLVDIWFAEICQMTLNVFGSQSMLSKSTRLLYGSTASCRSIQCCTITDNSLYGRPTCTCNACQCRSNSISTSMLLLAVPVQRSSALCQCNHVNVTSWSCCVSPFTLGHHLDRALLTKITSVGPMLNDIHCNMIPKLGEPN